MKAMNQSQLDWRNDSIEDLRNAAATLAVFSGDLQATGTHVNANIDVMSRECLLMIRELQNITPEVK